MTDLTLATLLSSRICHDLISPVSAVNNGLEILAEEQDSEMRTMAMNLIQSSAATASAKLQFMRICFGVAGSMAETIPLDDARELAESLTGGTPVALDWRAGDVLLDKEAVKLLLNFILIGFEALPRGGTLHIGARKEGATSLMISAEGPKARMQEASAEILRNGAPLSEIDAKQSSLFLTHEIAKKLGATVHVMIEDERIEIGATI
jgi:histidine phosphotransferase ChpT